MSGVIDIPCSKCGGTGRATADDPARYWAKVADVTAVQAAKLIREAAQDCRQQARECESDLVEMYIEDARDLRLVAKLCRAEDFQGAMNHARSMDTAAREWIPQLAWDFMDEQVTPVMTPPGVFSK